MREPNFKDREIFRMGAWRASSGKVEATSEMLDQMVTSYAELNSKVTGYAIPIKLGHNRRVGEPAMGYAENVRREGDTLIADFFDMPPEIVDAINTKRYNAVSVEIWPSVTVDENTKFSNVLSGVALLGAEWPAVKGLKPVYAAAFAAQAALTLSQEEAEMNFTQEQHDTLLAAAVAKATADAAAELTSAQVALAASEAERDTAKAALAVLSEEAEKKAIAEVIDAAEKAGKIVPANKDKVSAFAEILRKSVKAEDRKAALDQFKAFVEAMPKLVDFKEQGSGSSERPGDEEASAGAEAVKRANAMAKAEKIEFKAALVRVFEADADLKERYAAENGSTSHVAEDAE